MNLQEIKGAVEAGKTVHWASKGYRVIKDSIGQWLIHCTMNDTYIGLTWRDNVTMNGEESQFFLSTSTEESA
jgi:hypothetical protein